MCSTSHPKWGCHRSWCPPGSIEKSGMTGCIYETGEQCCLLADVKDDTVHFGYY
jgi:hypothetical protein